MSVIKLSCVDQVLTFTNTPVIASGGVGEDFVEITFCSLWDGYEKTAIFFKEDTVYVKLIDGATGRCAIPYDVLAEPGKFRIGVFGINAEEIRRSSIYAEYTVLEGAVTAVEDPKESLDIYEQVLAAMAGKQDRLTWDAAPTKDSANAVSSGATFAALQECSKTDHTHSNYVPTSRKVNNKALSSNITLAASDVGAAPSDHNHDSAYMKKYGLNGCNVDNTPGNWTADISDTAHGTVPEPFVTVVQFSSDHFLFQLGLKSNPHDSTTRKDSYIWARNKYNANAWSAWEAVGTEAQFKNNPTNFGKFRINEGWLGMYASADNAIDNVDRLGYIGYDTGSILRLVDQLGTGMELMTKSGDIRLRFGDAYMMGMYDSGAYWRPTKNGGASLGSSSYKWSTVYATNGTIQTSDRDQKENIQEIEQKHVDLFDMLRPVSYELTGENHDRVHIGFISQDVKAAMDELGLTDLDFAGYCRDVKMEDVIDEETGEVVGTREVLDENGEPVYLYSLRYSEFIALNTKMIQLNREKIAEQQARIKALEAAVAKLTAALEK